MASKKSSPKNPLTYRGSGVNIAAGEEAVSRIKQLAKATFTPGVLTDIGSFGGLFQVKGYKEPVLVSSMDGVGTKIRMAWLTGMYDTVGVDLVNHCVNDILAMGAEPLFFLDYIGTGKLKPDVVEQIIKGFSIGCKSNGCALIGGEMAEMPLLYKPNEFDLVGTIVGVVEKSKIITGSSIVKGDVLIGLPSSGLHTNGYSLVYNILESGGIRPVDHKEELMHVHRSYLPEVKPLLPYIKGIAHITGGGIPGNLRRILPKTMDAMVKTSAWEIPDFFTFLQETGRIADDEMFSVFNMGIGMILVVAKKDVATVQKKLPASMVLGEIVAGKGEVKLQ
ncbi:phosphoribosylformylglycinamidine cyclo-ligase [Candidatus Woesearchaeota archaeon]|nr:phosphoribosylformylglycinamidine cyclo-ligase [Candidatus Woesearchaeota archaeon]